ncbi:hypothetical protein [Lysobacter sp. CA199]|uniref:hypothetical protein n=1 Tax=Lysobacter sp. CA199 TaxID=3455608 RepID=UPI003F8D650B
MMAIWQFKFALVPVHGLKRVYGDTRRVLDEYRKPGSLKGDGGGTGDNFPNYWEGLDIDAAVGAVGGILPRAESWSPEAKMFGQKDGDWIEVWDDDVVCALDLREFSAEHLQAILAAAVALDCKLVLYGSGEVIDPILDLIMQKIKLSSGYEFCADPINFLRNQ